MHFNVDAFCKDLKAVNWNSAPGPDGPIIVNKFWHDFKQEFITIADCHAPLMQCHMSLAKHKHKSDYAPGWLLSQKNNQR